MTLYFNQEVACRVEQEQQLRADAEGEAAEAWRKAKSYKKRAEKAACELDTLTLQEWQKKYQNLEFRQDLSGTRCSVGDFAWSAGKSEGRCLQQQRDTMEVFILKRLR